MKNRQWNRKGFTLVELLVVIAIIVALAALATPAIMKQRKKADMVQAVSNAKNIHLIMLDFEGDFGSFPDSTTAQESSNAQAFTGNASNILLGQLIAEGYVKSEDIFYAKGGNPAGNKKPDNVITPISTSTILKAGECGFAYTLVTGGNSTKQGERALSTSDNGAIPLLATPVASSQGTFKTEPFDERGVYVRIDGAARSERINSTDQQIKLGGGKTLFQTGTGTAWGEGDAALTPSLKLPQ